MVLGGRDDGVMALARQRAAEQADLVTDDVAPGRAGDTQRSDTKLGRPRAKERSADAGRSPAAGRGRCARLGGRSGFAAVPEGQQSPHGAADRTEAVDGLGVDRGRKRE